MNKIEVIDKVQKILRKADKSKNSCIEEAELAMVLAHKLLKKYHLNMSQVLSVEDKQNNFHSSIDLTSQVGATFKAPTVPKWMSILISSINQVTQTKNLIRYGKPEGQKQYGDLHIIFIGDETDVAIATELFSFLRNTITKLASKHVRKKKLNFQQWRSFAEGCSCKLLARALKDDSGRAWNQDNDLNECCVDNFVINDDDEIEDLDDEDIDERIEEDDLNIENREINKENEEEIEQKYEIFLVSKQKKIDDFIDDFSKKNQRVEKEEISNSSKLDQKSFELGSKAADKIPLRVQKQLCKKHK